MTKKAKIELIIKILLILVFVPVGVVSLAAKKEATWSGTYETDKNNTTATGSPFSEKVRFKYKTKGFYVDGDTIKFGWHDQQYGNDNDTYSGVKHDFTNKIPDGGTAGTDISEPTFSIPGLYRRYARLFYLEDGQENDIEMEKGHEHDVKVAHIGEGIYYNDLFVDWTDNINTIEDLENSPFTEFNVNVEKPTENYRRKLIWDPLQKIRGEINLENEEISQNDLSNWDKNYSVDFNNFYGINLLEDIKSSTKNGITYYNALELYTRLGKVLRDNRYKDKLQKIEINPISPTSSEDNSEEPVNLASFSNKNLAYAFSFFDMCKGQEPNYSQQVLTESLIGNGLVKQDEKNLRNSII